MDSLSVLLLDYRLLLLELSVRLPPQVLPHSAQAKGCPNRVQGLSEFVEGAGGASSMVGQFVKATSSKAYSLSQGVGGRGGFGFSRDLRERTLANGRRRILEVASRLRLGGHYVDSAHRLFTIAVEKNFVQGRRTVHVVAACLYIACRQERSQHMLIDFLNSSSHG